MLLSLPLVRSSTTCTRAPLSSRESTRCEPIKDAPPVTRTFLLFQIGASVFFARHFFHDLNESFEFVYSSIFSGGFPGATAHFDKFGGVISQIPDRRSHGCRIIGVG